MVFLKLKSSSNIQNSDQYLVGWGQFSASLSKKLIHLIIFFMFYLQLFWGQCSTLLPRSSINKYINSTSSWAAARSLSFNQPRNDQRMHMKIVNHNPFLKDSKQTYDSQYMISTKCVKEEDTKLITAIILSLSISNTTYVIMTVQVCKNMKFRENIIRYLLTIVIHRPICPVLLISTLLFT